MKKLITLLAVSLSLSANAQIQHNMYMDSLGYEHVSIPQTPQVALSGYYQNLLFLPTLNNNITRPINSTTFTISSTRTAVVSYSVSISCTATIGGAATGSLTLQYSTNGGGIWNNASQISNSNTITLAIALNSVQIQGGTLSGIIPAGALVRIVSATTGTTTNSYLYGQEYY